MLHQLFHDESGVIISAEIVLVLTIAVLAMIVGLSEVAVAVNCELNDISNALGALNQSYAYTGFSSVGATRAKSGIAGTLFLDSFDDCDNNTSCDLVSGTAAASQFEGGVSL